VHLAAMTNVADMLSSLRAHWTRPRLVASQLWFNFIYLYFYQNNSQNMGNHGRHFQSIFLLFSASAQKAFFSSLLLFFSILSHIHGILHSQSKPAPQTPSSDHHNEP